MSLWRGGQTLETLNTGRMGLIAHLDIVFVELGADFLSASMPVDERTWQPYGLLHGGASVALAETVGSTAAMLCVDGTRHRCVGQEINANHVRPVRSGRVVGTARPAHVGARSHVWTIEITDEQGGLVCISRLTVAVIAAATPVR